MDHENAIKKGAIWVTGLGLAAAALSGGFLGFMGVAYVFVLSLPFILPLSGAIGGDVAHRFAKTRLGGAFFDIIGAGNEAARDAWAASARDAEDAYDEARHGGAGTAGATRGAGRRGLDLDNLPSNVSWSDLEPAFRAVGGIAAPRRATVTVRSGGEWQITDIPAGLDVKARITTVHPRTGPGYAWADEAVEIRTDRHGDMTIRPKQGVDELSFTIEVDGMDYGPPLRMIVR